MDNTWHAPLTAATLYNRDGTELSVDFREIIRVWNAHDDMLTALIAAEACLTVSARTFYCYEEATALKLIRAAIAKATGKVSA